MVQDILIKLIGSLTSIVLLLQATATGLPNTASVGSPQGKVLGATTATFQQDVNGYSGTDDVTISTQNIGSDGKGITSANVTGAMLLTNINYESEELLRFQNLGIPTGATITSASLTLEFSSWASTGFNVIGKYLNTDWDVASNSLGWTKRNSTYEWSQLGAEGDGIDTIAGKSFTFSGFNTLNYFSKTVALDTQVVSNWVNNPSSNQGLLLYLDTAGKSARVFPARYSNIAYHPILSITYEYTSDSTVPSIPTNLSATAVSSSVINLSWTVSTDNIGVTGYKIYRNGSQVGTSAINSYSDIGLSSNTTYTYSVSAYDAAGNNSSQSISASATTQPVSIDTTSPVISGISASSITQTSVNINWTTNENSDSQIEYGLTSTYASNSALNTSLVVSHNSSLSNLSASTLYHYRVKSRDVSGNLTTSADNTFSTSAIQSSGFSHPRIWLDSATLTRLNALVAANDPTWLTLKARADVLVVAPVVPYSYPYNSGNIDPICYGCVNQYRGSGWGEALTVLSMAYKMTGNTIYSDKVKGVMKVMIAAGINPINDDNGYEVRNFVGQLGIAYDWIYPELSASTDTIGVGSGNDISNLTALLDSYWTTVNSNVARSYEWYNNTCGPAGNFYWGYMQGFGEAAIAMEGDDANALTIRSNLASRISTCFVPSVSQGGVYQGAFNSQGTAYASQYHTLDYIWALKTSGTENAVLGGWDYTSWIKQLSKQTIHFLTPKIGYWQYLDEGDIQANGAYTMNMYKTMVNRIPVLLGASIEGGWAQYILNRYTGGKDSPFSDFLYKTSINEVNFNLTEPLSYISPGDFHSFMRSDWTSNAAQTMFNGNAVFTTGHQDFDIGTITVRRGSDYLLVNPNSCTTANCYGPGDGSDYGNQGNWMTNGLFVDDSTLYPTGVHYCGALDSLSGSNKLAGCQNIYNKTVTSPSAHTETPTYAYSKLNLTSLYGNNGYVHISPLTTYYRSWISFGDISFVYDNVVARTPNGGHRSLYWHLPTNAVISAAGPAVSSTVGASTLWISTLIPSTNIKAHFEQDYKTYSGFTLTTTNETTVGNPILKIANPTYSYQTNAATVSGTSLHFAPMIPVGVVFGMSVTDLTNPTAIPAGTTIKTMTEYAPGTVELTNVVTGTGVASGDVIKFSRNLPGMVVSGTGIPAGTTILSATETTATMSTNAVGAGITEGDQLNFTLNSGDNSKALSSKRLVIDDNSYLTNVTTPFLTVLAATNSGVSTPVTSLISGSGYTGALYNDGTLTRVVLFSTNGTAQSGFSYSITTSGNVRHIIVDLAPGTYTVKQNGTVIATQTAGADGTITFTSTGGGTFSSGTPSSDTTPPSTPTSLSATAVSSSGINLSWTASTDNTAVTGYNIYRAGTKIGTSAINSYSDSGITASTNCSYTVSAYDAAGNNSSQSSSASATTQPGSSNSTKFIAGQRVKTTSNLNVRATASATGTLLGTQSLGSLGTIVNGGQSVDGYYWWNVNYDTGADGYSVEDYLTAYTAAIVGDFNHDGLVNSIDLSMMITAWNTNNATYDLNHDGIVNSLDYTIMVQNWSL